MELHNHFRIGSLQHSLRLILISTALILSLIWSAITAFAYWPVFPDIHAELEIRTIDYEVYDSSRSQLMSGSYTCSPAYTVTFPPYDVLLGWYWTSGSNFSVGLRAYDPYLGAWMGWESEEPTNYQHVNMVNDDGVVGWYYLQQGDYYVYYTTYDPFSQMWKTDSTDAIDGITGMITAEGIALWRYASPSGKMVGYSIYDPTRESWMTGTSGPYPGFTIETWIINATAHWSVGGSDYMAGYDYTSGTWSEEYTHILGYFHAAPTSIDPEDDVYFTDMSIAATNWNWDLDNGYSSNDRSLWYDDYDEPGYYTVVQTVTNPLGSDDQDTHEEVITVGTPPILLVSPTSLTFNATIGSGNPPPQTFQISNLATPDTIPFNYTIDEGLSWLWLSQYSGGPVPPSATITANVDISGLPAGIHDGYITVTAPGASGSPQTVDVTLNLAEGTPNLSVSPLNLDFIWTEGGAPPSPQDITIENTGYGSMDWLASESLEWLDIVPDSGSGLGSGQSQTATCTIEEPFPGVGIHDGTITVEALGATGSPQTVDLTLDCQEGTPVLSVIPDSLFFVWTEGEPPPSPQDITVENTGYGSMEWTADESLNWLVIEPDSGSGVGQAQSDTAACSIVGSYPGVGLYSGMITLEAPGATGSPQTVNVTLDCQIGTPMLSVSPTSLTFNWQEGQPPPSPQDVTITNTGYGSMDWNADESISWLTISPDSGIGLVHSQSDTVTCSIIEPFPGTGIYSDTITVTAPGATGSPVIVDVTLDCQEGIPILSVNPDSLYFEWVESQPPPDSQILTVSNTGYGTLNWTSVLDVSWASISLDSGSLQHNLTDSVVCSILEPFPGIGAYTGSVIISDTNAVGSPQSVQLMLDCVSAPYPVSIILTPLNPPIIIPATGGNFQFDVTGTNSSSDPQTFDLWLEAYLPQADTVETGVWQGLTLLGGETLSRIRDQRVPPTAPAGIYTYCANIGEYPLVIEDCDSFTFLKEGDNFSGNMGSPSDWLCSGEPFDDWMTATQPEIPKTFAVSVYPNPFNPTITICYQLPVDNQVKLTVYDISGKLAKIVVNGYQSAGFHEAIFNGSNLGSGIYIYRLQAGESTSSGKMVLMK